MPKITKEEVIEVLEEMATLLELKGENVFKIRAFQNGARVLETQSTDLATLIDTGELEKLKGIGKGISAIIHDLYKKGKSKDYEDLKKGFPETLFELFKIPGLGGKRIKVLYEKLGIKSVGELEYACKENRLLALDGFGEKSQEKVLKGIEQLKRSAGHYLISRGREQALKLLAYLNEQKGILKAEIAGSIRRQKEVIKDIDILVACKNPKAIHEAFLKYPDLSSVIAQGETKSSITLKNGMACDLRTVSLEEFPYALYYFTGSKEHNVAVRTIAKSKGYKINEYGLFKGKKSIACKSEEDIFEALGLHYVPPEARENHGEVEWVSKKEFPKLVEEKDIRGIFHVHSTYSDGRAPLEAMIKEAERLGYEYVGISDHSQSAGYAHGLDAKRLEDQWKEIDQLQKRFKIRILKGVESDILGDGALDYPESILKQFDFVIGSVHSRFQMTEKEMNERVRRAMENKYLNFVGHPTGRLLLAREGFSISLEKLVNYAKEYDVVLEVNANPHRLDLDWRACRLAKKEGVLLSIHPDAHSVEGLSDVQYGVGIARKGWLEKKEVLNTKPLIEVEKVLKQRR